MSSTVTSFEGLDETLLPRERREAAFERFSTLHSGREKPGRFWRIDVEGIAPAGAATPAALALTNPNARAVVCDLAHAANAYPELLARAVETTAVRSKKFGALALAMAQTGAFVYVPQDVACDDPIVLDYRAADGTTSFTYTVVLLERGARATIVQRLAGAPAFACDATEIVAEESAQVTYAVAQTFDEGTQAVSVRAARPGRNARVTCASAELGGALVVGDVFVDFEQPGANAEIDLLFFAGGSQHVDLISTATHRVGDTSSQTLVKSAATGRGQARYLGNIFIAPKAQGSDASLRDDALLLSPHAHIDSIPALEIGANDVKAYHGATVGALDDEQIFYMESRGIPREQAERMIALGFFGPAVDRFPTEALRGEIRARLEARLT